jgi:hypothetical protein
MDNIDCKLCYLQSGTIPNGFILQQQRDGFAQRFKIKTEGYIILTSVNV